MKIISLFLVLMFLTTEICDARSRMGRSFGRRGSRSLFNTKKSPYNSYNKNYRNKQGNNRYNQNMNKPRSSMFGGGFMKSMMGAVAGTMIGGMLFRAFGMNTSGMGASGGSGMGILFPLLLIAGAYFLFFRRRKAHQYAQTGGYNQSGPQQHDYIGNQNMTYNSQPESDSDSEESNELDISNNESFIKERNKDFFQIQHAWSKKDLNSVKELLTTEVYDEFNNEIKEMNEKNQTSILENLMINDSMPVASWNEEVTKFITLKFDVSLIEYIQNNQGEIVSGKKGKYTDITEYWTFKQEGFNCPWQVCAVENPS